jgi:serine/threonine-protein kinase
MGSAMSFNCPHCGQPHEDNTTVCPHTNEAISPSHHLVGKVIADKYEVLKLLGEGGMGAVYLAKHTQVGKRFAIKLLHEQFAHNTEMVERFMREARAAGEVGHDNIIEVYDIGKEASGAVYMVMELLKGQALEDVVSQGPMPVPLSCYVMLQVLSALEAAHAQGIVHRDMKPDNVFLTTIAGQPNFVKVLDFGIAKIKSGEGSHGLTQTGTMMGTPYFMSPEQARGSRDINHRTDLYACGVMFYQMLTGVLPFDAPNIPALLVKITSEDPVPAEQINPQIPVELAEAIRKAMARDPDVRFQNAGEFADVIRPFAQQDVSFQHLAAAKPAFDTDAGSTAPGQTTPMGWTASGEAPAPARRTGVVVGIVLAVLVLLGGGAVAALFGLGVLGGGEEQSGPATQPIVAPRVEEPEEPEVETVEFIVAVSPEDATITLDGAELEGNPVKLDLEKSNGSRLLMVRAEGHEDYKEWIRLDADFSRTITLEEEAPEETPSAKTGRRKKKKKSPPSPQPSTPSKTSGKGKGKGKGSIDEDNPYK